MSGTSFIHVHANASTFTTSSFSSAVLKARDVQFCSAVHFRKMRGVSACPFLSAYSVNIPIPPALWIADEGAMQATSKILHGSKLRQYYSSPTENCWKHLFHNCLSAEIGVDCSSKREVSSYAVTPPKSDLTSFPPASSCISAIISGLTLAV